MGLRGLTIGTSAPGMELDHPDLDGLWETAARLDMPIVLHPLYLYGDPRLDKYDLPNAIGRVNDTAIAVSRLLYAGAHQASAPAAQRSSRTAEVACQYALGRLTRNFELNPGWDGRSA